MASVARLVSSVLGKVRRVMEKHKERERKLYCGLRSLKNDMEMVNTMLKKGDLGFHGALQETRILQLQELAYDVEDFVESLWEPGNYGYLLVAIGTDRRPQLLESIEGFNNRITSLQKEWKLSDESGKNKADADDDDAGSSESARCKDPEVIDAPKKKLLELLSTSPAELRVISIVGCRGVGKTALARAVYDDPDVCSQFGCVEWFEASGCKNPHDLLSKAPENSRTEASGAATATVASLRDLPVDTRYLVFINDVQQPHMWKDTVRALLEKCQNSGISSRIIMTTSVHSVSTACSSGSYVYRMQCLGQDESQDLFWRKVYGCQCNPPRGSPLDEGSKSIFNKCDGLPLALSSVAKYLGANADRLERRDCEEMGRDLGRRYLSGDHDVFREMRTSLVQCCRRLPDYDHRACLLYLSVFPRAHHIKNKSLVRKLVAEGLVATAQDGSKCVNMLIDHCIVDAVQFSSDSRDAKRCRVHGIVLEYIIQKSVSKNIVTLIHEDGMQTVDSAVARVRRLSIQSSNQETCDEIPTRIGLSDVRSLTIFDSVPNFKSCKKLRLLDLEGCTWAANDSHFLDGICGLFLLKYLSLRKTGVKKLPTLMEKLQCLETLDIRETNVEMLPLEVIMLPKLAHLFGKFELPDVPKVTNTVYDFLTKTSELQTLAGFVVDRSTRGLEQIILQAPKLKKVKIWCNDTSASDSVPMGGSPAHVLGSSSASASAGASFRPLLKRKICTLNSSKRKERTLNQNLTVDRADERGTTGNISSVLLPKKCFTSLESVSIVSSALCEGFLGSLEGSCNISSIKLRGKLERLPDSTKLHYLDKINKLQLFSSGLSSEDLSALQMLPGLEYLKLVEDGDRFCNGIFIVKKDGFQSLKRLCIEAPKIPTLQFMEGAMGFVISLHLLCPCSAQTKLAAETIEGFSHLTRLNEVVIHASASQDTIQAWETVANRHPKWPSVVKPGAK